MKRKPAWCANDPLVTVPLTDTPKPITLIVPYYENPKFLARHYDRHWRDGVSWHMDDMLSVIVVDDGSPQFPAQYVLSCPKRPTMNVRLFRIEVDVRWNWLAARNIGFKHADTDWCLVTDMDHVVPPETLRSCIYGQHDPKVVYGFSRQEHTGHPIAPHPNSWFLTKELFWKIGGYDESFSGYYGTDGEWRRRVREHAPIHILTDPLIRYEYHGDSSTTHYKRKQAIDANVSRIIKARKKGWKPKTLSFPYREVQL